jgi:hypothetical protein
MLNRKCFSFFLNYSFIAREGLTLPAFETLATFHQIRLSLSVLYKIYFYLSNLLALLFSLCRKYSRI